MITKSNAGPKSTTVRTHPKKIKRTKTTKLGPRDKKIKKKER